MVRDGYWYAISLLLVAAVVRFFTADWFASWLLVLIPVLLAAFFLWFFRDPERAIPAGPGLVVSPADGKITEVAPIHTVDGDRIRLSIFLSVFDVHVNRSPVAGVLRDVRYRKGEFLNAMNPVCAERNEQNQAIVDSADGYLVAFTQIAGLLARRIVFRFKVGDFVERGQRVGLIKFGSRVDVLLPGHAHVRVALGQRVKGGASVLADIHPPEDDPSLEVLQESFA